jgi:hypothetical protein
MTAVQQWLRSTGQRPSIAAQWLDNGRGWTRSNGNKTMTFALGQFGGCVTDTYRSSSKRYFEVLLTGAGRTDLPYAPSAGVVNSTYTAGNALPGSTPGNGWVLGSDGHVYTNSASIASGIGTYATGEVMMFALDCSTKKLWVGRNGTWTGNPAAGTGEIATITGTSWSPSFGMTAPDVATAATLRTIPSAFSYAIPSGFRAWS